MNKDEKNSADKIILIVEDSIELCEILKDLLVEFNFTTIYADSADKGLQLLEKNKVFGMILDLVMPVNDGKYLLMKSQELNLLPEEIVVFSGLKRNALSDLPEEIKKNVTYFEKPNEMFKLLDKIKSWSAR